MKQHATRNMILFVVVATVLTNITGLVLPFWYRKEGYDHVMKVDTTPTANRIPTLGTLTNMTTPTAKRTRTLDMLTVNATLGKADCVINMEIHEGLWERHCKEYIRSGCVNDVQEMCDGMDYPEYNRYVLCIEVGGDFILVIVAVLIIRSKLQEKKLHLEMIGVKIGLGGLLMILGALVFATEDSGEISYLATDLHAGWGLCLATGSVAILACLYCMYRDIKDKSRSVRHYFPINDDSVDFSDEEMIEV